MRQYPCLDRTEVLTRFPRRGGGRRQHDPGRLLPLAVSGLILAVLALAFLVAAPAAQAQDGDTITKIGDGKARGYEPTNVQVVPGDGELTVSWTATSRPGVDDDEIYHALRWSQEYGVFHNGPMPRHPLFAQGQPTLPPTHGILIEPGVTSYKITGLKNRVVTGVHVRSLTGVFRAEDADASSQWVRVKGTSTTPVADEVVFDAAGYSVAEGRTVTLGLTRYAIEAASLDDPLTVTLATADGTAASSDYTAFSGRSIAMAANVAAASSAVVTASDDLVEEDETLTVTVSVPETSKFGAGDPSTTTVTITDDDRAKAKVAFGNSAASTTKYTATVAEAVTGGTLNVPVTVSHLPGASTTFKVEVLSAGTATEGSDFSIAAKSVTFGPTDSSKTKNVAIALTDDSEHELDETIELRIAAADDPVDDLGDHYARNSAGATAAVTVTSEDQRSATKTYAIPSAVTVTEGNNAQITLTLGEATTESLAFKVSATYTHGRNKAIASDAKNLRSSTHTVASGKRSDTISIPIPTDGLVENSETFTVTVTTDDFRWSVDPDNGNTATVTIHDNDRATAKIAFGRSAGSTTKHAVTVAENASSFSRRLSVPISVNHWTVTPVTFNVEMLDTSTATEGEDFYFPETKSVTFDKRTTQNLVLYVKDDTYYEENETIELRIVAADNPVNDLGDHFARHAAGATATITITSDESHFVIVDQDSLTVETGATATYTVVLTDEPTRDVTVTPQSTTRLAAVSGPVTFTKDDWSVPQEITVTGGTQVGGDTITHRVSSDDTNFSSANTQSVSVSVAAPPEVAEVEATKFYAITSAATVTEGQTAELTVTLSEAAPAAMTFNVKYAGTATAADSGGGRPGSVTVAAGKTTATLRIPTVADSHVESNETIELRIAGGQGVTEEWGKKTARAGSATVTIQDATIAVSLGKTSFSVGEGGGSVTVPIAFSSATGEAVTLRIRPGSPNAGTRDLDYQRSNTLTVPSGATAVNYTVTILDDSVRENDETFVIRFEVQSPAAGYGVGAAGEARITITDNDTAGVTVSDSAVTVREGSTAAYTVKLQSRPVWPVTVTPSSGDPDKARVSGPLLFSTTDWNTPKTVTVTGVKPGTATISHGISSNDPFYRGLSIDSVDATVTSAKVYGISATASANEGANAQLTVTLLKDAPAGGLSFTVTPVYGTGSGKAAAADLGSPPTTVSVAQNQRTATLSIPIVRDALVEGDETFKVTVATSAPGWSKSAEGADTATVTITDLTRAVSVAASSYTVGESDGKVTVGLNVSGSHADTITATLTLADGTAARSADYGGGSATAQATFAAGATSATVDVAIADDDLIESSETFTVTVTAVSAGHAIGSSRSATVTITDDDSAAVKVSPTTLRIQEFGAGADYSVVLGSKPTANVIVTPSSSSKTNATVGGPVTFTPGDWNKPQKIRVSPVQDGSATISHTVTGDAGYAGLIPDTVAVTVAPYGKTYAITPAVTVTEGGSARLQITLGETAPRAGLTFDLEFTFDTPGPGKAQAVDIQENFVARAKSLTLSVGQTSGAISVPIVAGDGLVEEDETFTVSLKRVHSGGSPVPEWKQEPGGAKTATVTIKDRDASRAKVAFGTDAASTTRYTASVAENVVGGTLNVPVTVSHLPAESTTFTIVVAGSGTATEGSDFSIATKSVTFGPTDAGRTQNLVVALTDDGDVETAETIVLSIAAADDPVDDLGDHYARNANGAAATITVNSDDVASGSTKTYALTPTATAAEGASAELTVTLGENAPAGGVAFTVTYDYSGSAATAGDTGATPATLTVESGARTATLSVPLARDGVEDDGETFTVTIVASTAGWAKSPTGVNTATVTIADATEAISFSARAFTVIEGQAARVVITRTGPATDSVKVDVSALGYGPLARGLGYVTRTVTMQAGASSATAVLATVDNQEAQANGGLTMWMSDPPADSGYILGDNSATLVIVDDDGDEYTRTYTMGTAATADEGATAALTVTLGENAPEGGVAFTVTYDYSGGSATADDVGAAAPTTLAVAAGSRTATLRIPIAADDDTAEGDETFVVSITPGAGDTDWALAPSGSASATVTIKNVSGPSVVALEKDEGPVSEIQLPSLSWGGATIADKEYTVGAPVPYPHDTTADQEKHKLPAVTPGAGVVYTATGLPAGLVMTRDRIIRGTPTEATSNPVTVTYTATRGQGDGGEEEGVRAVSVFLTFKVTVKPPVAFDQEELRPFTDAVIEYTVGQATPLAFEFPEAGGGSGTLTYHLSHQYPMTPLSEHAPGLSFDADTRVLSSGVGTEEPEPQRHALHYWAEDDNGARAFASGSIEVNGPPSLPAIDDKNFTVGEAVSVTLPAATGGSTRFFQLRYSLEPEVPGLSFDPLTRTLSGTATATGAAELTYTVTDRHGVTDTETFTVTVAAAVDGSPPTAAPGSVQATQVPGSKQVMVVWQPVAGATDYVVQVAAFVDSDNDGSPDAGSFPTGFGVTAWPTGTGYEVMVVGDALTAVVAVPEYGRYAVRVAAVNADGAGPWATTTAAVSAPTPS